ncbi:methyl-accepting chemotaxis protein [Treponema ruminis]|uniref:Methyl-accepting chemotaxis protein n=1 Tax=Treponema ruminis TaxID=744515 RepID=A0A7W8G9E0_9SPIR|nr:methyl-accepting chemotaxis protein [Treponema ruminis]MBB5226268.1 methyl-accepting chemotaxis protein [Treponema ruminis]QSI02825.1 methyl-accepting chemotaxis protein [Treponema ruminis]
MIKNFNNEGEKKGFEMTFVKRSMLLIGTPVAVFFVITAIILAGLVSNFTEQQAYRLMFSNMRECVLSFEKTLTPPSKVTEALAFLFSNGFYESDSKNSVIFEDVSQIYPEFPGFYGCRTDGSLFTSQNIEVPEGYDATEENWYTGALEYGGEIFYSPVYNNKLTDSLVVTISRAVYKDDEIDGVVAFDFPIVDLQNFVGEIKNDDLDMSFILSPDGDFFMHGTYSPDENIKTVEGGKYHDLGENLLMAGDDFVYGKFNNVNYVFRVSPIPLTGWYYVLGKSVKDVNSFSHATKILLISAFTVLFIVIMAITAFIISRMRSKEQEASRRLIEETQSLAVSSKENAATAQDQNAAIKEIVATMEDNTALSEDISQKIKDVSGVATKTSSDVTEGVSYLEENVRQLHEIAQANQSTINGIKNLGDKIENIWDIVTLINSVADQAKIIAFNAELEASTAGAAGRNFHIVATEIRRLADGIIDGTKEIKSKITEIQQSSDSLILASESGTEKIQEGVANAKNLEERFSSIKNASEITADSAGSITTIIQQQTIASEQILLTLKQIASGVENFSSATTHISVASETLKSIAEDLNK